MIILNITNSCNKQPVCNYCFNYQEITKKEKYFMDVGKVYKIIKSLQYNTQDIGLSGGEPTLHPSLDEIVATILNENKRVLIATNLEKYRDVEPHKNLYWQMSLHLDNVDKRLETLIKYLSEGHNINCFIIPVSHENYDQSRISQLSYYLYELSPTTPLYFRYIEDTFNFKNKLSQEELKKFVHEIIKHHFHPYARAVFNIKDNFVIEDQPSL